MGGLDLDARLAERARRKTRPRELTGSGELVRLRIGWEVSPSVGAEYASHMERNSGYAAHRQRAAIIFFGGSERWWRKGGGKRRVVGSKYRALIRVFANRATDALF